MTTTEARQLAQDEPREFEALVAAAVMGWHDGMTQEEWPYWLSDDDGCPHPRCPDYLGPSMDPAWSVVDHLRSEGWKWFLNERRYKWHAEIWRPGVKFEDGWTQHIVADKDVRLAICLAALQAVGVVS